MEVCSGDSERLIVATNTPSCVPSCTPSPKREEPLRIAVSSRCLFDLDEDANAFSRDGLEAHVRSQIAKEMSVLRPGPAFPLMNRMLALTSEGTPLVEGIIVSGQHPFVGMRVMASAKHYGLPLDRAIFTGGRPSHSYLTAMGVDLFLTRNAQDAQLALDAGVAAAVMGPLPTSWVEDKDSPITLALDGDAVIFDDECEAVSKRDGLKAFYERQEEMLTEPLADGPFAKLFRRLNGLREQAPGAVRICLVTARDSVARDRALMTLRAWGIQPDEAYFLGGIRKGGIIKAMRPHIFLDDAVHHIQDSGEHAPSGRVPYLSSGKVAGLS